jgi:hypothetical protein
MPSIPLFDALLGTRSFVAAVSSMMVEAILAAFILLFLVFLFRLVVRSEWLAAGLLGILLALPVMIQDEARWIVGLVQMTYYLIFLFVSVRFGILAFVFTLFIGNLMIDLPITLDSSAWYSGAGFGALLILGALTGYAVHTAFGGRPLFGAAGAE